MRPTPRTDAAQDYMVCTKAFPDKPGGIGLAVPATMAGTLERELAEAVELLKAIIILDDGDQPDLWNYQDEFNAAHAFLKRMEGK